MSLPAAEVAADFRDALQDLKMNSRPEISNLTLIAKENTEYAQAISTELENHIKSVSLDCLVSASSFVLFTVYASQCM
jgi:pre-mRNA cleavage complex 2 protein Pcf11